MKNHLYASLMILLSANLGFGQLDYGFDFTKAGTAGMQFLKIGVGAREAALADAATSIVEDANAVFWNPAGLGFLEKRQLIGSHTQWLVDSRHTSAVVSLPVGSFVAAISVIYLAIEDFEETTVEQPLGTGRMVSASDIAIGLTVARRFTDRLSIGGQIKYVQEKLDDVDFDNLLFDVGTLYHTGFHHLRLAFTLQHFGPDLKVFKQKFRMPLLFRVGISDDLILTDAYRLTTAFDLVHPTDNDEWVSWAVEFSALNLIALRGGYRFNVDEGGFTAGIGLRPPEFSGFRLVIDYGYSSFGEVFGGINRFSIGFAF